MDALNSAACKLLRSMLEGIESGRLAAVGVAGVDTAEELSVTVRAAEIPAEQREAQPPAAPSSSSAAAASSPMSCPSCHGVNIGEPDSTGELGCNGCGFTWPAAPAS